MKCTRENAWYVAQGQVICLVARAGMGEEWVEPRGECISSALEGIQAHILEKLQLTWEVVISHTESSSSQSWGFVCSSDVFG